MWFIGMAAVFAVMFFSLQKQKLGGPAGPVPIDDSLKPSQSSVCETKLIKWIQSVNPERLQYNTDIESRVIELNRYWTTCGPAAGSKPLVSDLKPIDSLVTGDDLKRVLASRFGRRDIEYIRQTILLSRIAERVTKEYNSDLDRVVALVALLSPQMEPLPAQQSRDRPLTPFDSLLNGQASPADRAWVLAEAIRQLHIDSVVLTADGEDVHPLLAVLIEQDAFVFDSLTGWPVPAAGESQRKTIYRVPAKLKDALADDTILRQLDIDGRPYPWTAEKLKSARVGLVGTSCTWAPRMAELQYQWPTNQMCVIYDGLGPSTTIEKGLAERVTIHLTQLGYPADRVGVWSYPEQQASRYDEMGAEAAPYMVPLVDVMSGPRSFVEELDSKTNKVSVTIQKAKRPLQQARVQHLLGHRIDAIGNYLTMMRAHRSAPKMGGKIDSTVQQAMDQNRLLADKVVYWMSLVQFENDDYDACQGTLRSYTREFPLGEMRDAAILRQAACLEKAEKFDEAEKVLATIGPGLYGLKRDLFARRLKELQGPAATPPASTPEPAAKPEAPAGTPEPAPTEPAPPTTTEKPAGEAASPSPPGTATPPAESGGTTPPAPPQAEATP
ncbi:MAG: hypothetical protein U0929_13175 [Planctomycetaceae bacterium]